MNNLLNAVDEYHAVEQLHARGCTDGLPVIVPTPERVERMTLATGLDGDLVLGEMGPMGGAATVQKVAIAAVMAGCLTDHMPVVVAAVRAVCEPEFDLGEMQGTTHCTAPLVIVNGPARHHCGAIASGFGALGPGHRANASIGRALRLAMINIGGAIPGVSDMALHGQPGKFTCCLAEDEESSPFAPLHTSFGFDSADSVVTVVGAEAPHSTLFQGDADDPDSPDRLLRTIAAVIANPGSNNVHLGGRGAVTVILNPVHATVLGDAGYSREMVQEKLSEYAVLPRTVYEATAGTAFADKQRGDIVRAVREPSKILVLTAGGSGLYTMVMPSWCSGPHANSAVHARIDLDQFCEVPGAVT
ncbi:MAG: hypothetical protein K0U93_08640 [Gammaproteobacteria bacterium]|nr:hypothetical protein [Gammaproteobacteria bacterium]